MKNSIDVGSPRHFSVALPRERIAAKCIEYLAAISRLRAAASDLLAASRGAMQAEAALRLYRQLALFVGENFAHMHVEGEPLCIMRWMVPAMTPAEAAVLIVA